MPAKKNSKYNWLIATLDALEWNPANPWNSYPCLDWPWSTNADGYGHVRIPTVLGGQLRRVNRLTYEHLIGPLGPGLFSLHHCDRPLCFHPAHLFGSTHENNMADMVRKGRSRNRSREDHNLAKLNWEKVRTARSMRDQGATIKMVAETFGLSESATRSMLVGETWASLDGTAPSRRFENMSVGENSRSSKLNSAKVVEMRRLHSLGVSTCKLGPAFGVSQNCAWLVVNRKAWKHID